MIHRYPYGQQVFVYRSLLKTQMSRVGFDFTYGAAKNGSDCVVAGQLKVNVPLHRS